MYFNITVSARRLVSHRQVDFLVIRWVRQAEEPVNFSDGLETATLRAGHFVFALALKETTDGFHLCRERAFVMRMTPIVKRLDISIVTVHCRGRASPIKAFQSAQLKY